MTLGTGTEHPNANAVIVGVDGTSESDRAVVWAAKTALARNRDLHIVHGLALGAVDVRNGSPYLSVPGVIESLEAAGRTMLQKAEEAARAIDGGWGLSITTALSSRDPAPLLDELSDQAYMVVIGGTSTTFGSLDVAVASHGRGEVVIVRGDPASESVRSGPVVVGIDGSPTSEGAIAAAFEEAALRQAPLVAVHVWSDLSFGAIAGRPGLLTPPEEFEQAESIILSERLAGWQEKYPDVAVTRKIYMDGPRENLLKWSSRARMVVVGSRGRGGFRGMLLGSTSNALVQHANCPVFVVRPHPHRNER